jgi:hypothetical protein
MTDPRPRKPVRDRHGRRDQPSTDQPTGPQRRTATGPRRTTGPKKKPGRWTVGPPKVIPMTPEQYDKAIRAWTALLANWNAKNNSDTE